MVNISEKCNELWGSKVFFRSILVFILIIWSLGYLALIMYPFDWKNTNAYAYEDAYVDFNDPYIAHNTNILECNENKTIYIKFSFDGMQNSILNITLILPFSEDYTLQLVQNSWNENSLTLENIPEVISTLYPVNNSIVITDYISETTNIVSFRISTSENFSCESHEVIDGQWFPNARSNIHVNIKYTGFAINDIIPISIFTIIMILVLLFYVRSYKKDGVRYTYYCGTKSSAMKK